MEYKLFTDYITLQALLKECGVIHSGGAIKAYLANTTVLVNEEIEQRRGKKLRIGDIVTIPNLTITLIAPNQAEIEQYQDDKREKERVAALVKKLNKENKQPKTKTQTVGVYRKKTDKANTKKPIRFPGT